MLRVYTYECTMTAVRMRFPADRQFVFAVTFDRWTTEYDRVEETEVTFAHKGTWPWHMYVVVFCVCRCRQVRGRPLRGLRVNLNAFSVPLLSCVKGFRPRL